MGSGSGYLALVFAAMVAPPSGSSSGSGSSTSGSTSGGRVVGVEHIGELVGGSVAAAGRVGGWARRLMEDDCLRLLQVRGGVGGRVLSPLGCGAGCGEPG